MGESITGAGIAQNRNIEPLSTEGDSLPLRSINLPLDSQEVSLDKFQASQFRHEYIQEDVFGSFLLLLSLPFLLGRGWLGQCFQI